jgi:hypothetical protein
VAPGSTVLRELARAISDALTLSDCVDVALGLPPGPACM